MKAKRNRYPSHTVGHNLPAGRSRAAGALEGG